MYKKRNGLRKLLKPSIHLVVKLLILTVLILAPLPSSLSVSNKIVVQAASTKKAKKSIKATSIKVSGEKNLTLGKTTTLKVNFQPAKATKETLTYSSSDEKVVTVNSKGKVKAVGIGEATITVISKKGLIKSFPVNVALDKSINIKSNKLEIGQSKDKVIEYFGEPDRKGKSYYGDETYIYNDDLTMFFMIYFEKDKVVGYYTDALDFSYMGFTAKSKIDDKKFKQMNIQDRDKGRHTTSDNKYQIELYFDTIHRVGTQTLCGVRLLKNNVKINNYSTKVINDIELEILDLTNSIRVKNDLAPLEWSDFTYKSSKKHSQDMASNNYFTHNSQKGKRPHERMREEGIFPTFTGENIAAGYTDSVTVSFGWYQSFGHRTIMLGESYEYLGVGVATDSKSEYKIYYTQNYYGTEILWKE